MRDDLVKFYKHHIQELNERLRSIYKVKTPENYLSSNPPEYINLVDELEFLTAARNIYSELERMGVKEGEVYNQYHGYLENVESALKEIRELKGQVEKDNRSDITNTEILLNSFNKSLEELENN